MDQTKFVDFTSARFDALPPTAKSSVTRRSLLLQTANEYWKLVTESQTPSIEPTSSLAWKTLRDPLDFPTNSTGPVAEKGLIIRTDFSDENKWEEFIGVVLRSEREGMKDLLLADEAETSNTGGGDEDEDDESEEDGEPEGEDAGDEDAEMVDASSDDPNTRHQSDAFVFVDLSPSSVVPERIDPSVLQNSSNITLLRLFNDLDIVPSPRLPEGRKRINGSLGPNPANRLVDSHGLHEIYRGRLLWVYDAKSNVDGCARLITQRPNHYGLATGDSWRAKASFVWELQLNISAGTMTVDFGGADRFDSGERQRNFDTLRGVA
ncbi:hypothetical protein DL93DRAFT_2162783 [Clavulina sp. PMI_390]|nr:hypothetical protein DL93DRAFT_2162783 [Clavulina sp. PMI_390]